jgi:DNA-directed RNA polymerase II subunit RPB2
MNIIEDKEFDWENKTWDVIDTFFKQDNILIAHHLDSFNYFMSNELQAIVREKEFNPVKIYNKDTWNDDLQLYTETYQIEFGKIYISKPVLYDSPNKPMYPAEARLRKLTYGGNLYIDIHHKTIKIDPETGTQEVTPYPTLEKYPCGRMPIMVGSKYCVLSEQNSMTKVEMGEGLYDYGGYFIVKGSEKIIISQEKKCENKICVFKQKGSQSKYSENAEISCIHPDNPSQISPVWVKMKAKEESYGGNVIRVRLRRMKQDIPLVIIFRALNFISDKSIVELIVYNTGNEHNFAIMDMLKASIEEAKPIQTQKIALEYISKYITGINTVKYKNNKCKLKYTFDVLCSELFPHVGESPIKKAYFLGYMVNKLLKCNLGIIEYDDRDSFLNKRVEMSGELMAQLFRAYFGKFVKELKTTCEKDMMAGRISELPQNLSKKLKPNSIENDIKYALGTGNWGLKNQAKSRKGIAAVLQRLTYLGTISNMRRIVANITKEQKLTDPRKLHSTQWGVICPCETPEGASVGIVKNMALTCHITIPCSSDPIKASLDEFGVISLEGVKPIDIYDSVKVFVNGDWYGQSFEPKQLVDKLRTLRRNGILNPYISIAWYIQFNEIQIWTDWGRLCRPLYIMRDNKFVITNQFANDIDKKALLWKDLLYVNKPQDVDLEEMEDNAIIEYVDVNESDTLMICMSKDNLNENSKTNYAFYNYTHCEIHPSLMFGVLACNIPFPNHNQAPRNLYQGAMGKQAMGIYSTAFRERMDTMAHILHYPQKPLVNTETSKYVNSDNLPSGQMPIVAIACYTGYNQEDSLIFNQSAIDRGLFRSSFYRTYMDEEKKNSATLEDEKFCKPQKYYPNGKVYTEKMSFGSYDKLDTNGFVKIGSFVDGNDIIIGKVTMLKDAIEGEPKARDLSTSLRSNESGIVDKVYKNSNGEGYNFVKVRVRSDRIPEIGDKFCALPTQQVLTDKGWIEIKDIDIELHKVATLDKDGNMTYEHPTAKYEYDHDDKMYYIKNKQLHIICTLNHKLYVKKRSGKKYELIEAKDVMGKMVRFEKTMENVYPDVRHFTLGEKDYDMDEWLKLLGMFISDGWCDKSNRGIFITAIKERKIDYMKDILENLDISYSYHKDGNFFISCSKYPEEHNHFLDLSVGALNKYLPDYVWNLSKRQSIVLLEALLQGDGSKMEYKGETFDRYGTISPQLADDITRLALHCGWSGTVKISEEPTGIARVGKRNLGSRAGQEVSITQQHTYYKVSIIRKQNQPWINKKVNDSNEEKLIDYQGKVYCIEVPSSHTYYMRESKCDPTVIIGNSSRHGQKGTVGITYKQEDMPYTKDGVVPDIIMSPSAIPSRMTIAHMIECLFGKVGTVAGSELDATPFRKTSVENITEIMESMGYNGAGTEILYNGKTGEQMEAAIFMGPTFYYRLKHLVEDKQHCFDYETEILTQDGWKNCKSITMEDKVATLKDNKLVYDKPNAIYNYPDYQGDMVYVKNDFIDLVVTDNHRMWVSEDEGKSYNFAHAKDIIGKDLLYKNDCKYEHSEDFKSLIDKIFCGMDYIETDSQYMADKLQKEALQAGWVCIVTSEYDIYKCKLYKEFDAQNLASKNMQQSIVEDVQIPIWCVSVPSEVVMIRRNGKMCWTGNSRATGPYQLLTMQPAEGRSRDGGFRFGEMERDNMLSHGTVQFLKERTFDCSDKYFVWIDNDTGMISPVNPEKGIYKSLYSDNTTRFSKVQIPYSSKLLFQELQAMHILPRLMVTGRK